MTTTWNITIEGFLSKDLVDMFVAMIKPGLPDTMRVVVDEVDDDDITELSEWQHEGDGS